MITFFIKKFKPILQTRLFGLQIKKNNYVISKSENNNLLFLQNCDILNHEYVHENKLNFSFCLFIVFLTKVFVVSQNEVICFMKEH